MAKSTSVAPGYTLYRSGVVASDDIASVGVEEGLNSEDFEYANFVVVPSDGTNPSASIYYWNDTEEAWVLDVDFTTVTGAGGGVPYAFSVKTLGRIILVVLSSIRTMSDEGAWNADTNSPSLSDGVGTDGDWYTVSVAGATELDGISDWAVGDIVFFDTDAWTKTTAPAGSVAVHANTFGFSNRI